MYHQACVTIGFNYRSLGPFVTGFIMFLITVLALWEMKQNCIYSFRACSSLCQWGRCWTLRILVEQSQPQLYSICPWSPWLSSSDWTFIFHLISLTVYFQISLTAKSLKLGVWKYWETKSTLPEKKSYLGRLTQGEADCPALWRESPPMTGSSQEAHIPEEKHHGDESGLNET